MMPTAAPQQTARLEGVQRQLSRLLPLIVHQPHLKGVRVREGAAQAGRLKMNAAYLLAVRAYSTVRGSLAILGFAALAAFVVLPAQREVFLRHWPSLAASGVADPFSATVAAGSIQTVADSPIEREQRAVTEYLSKRY